MCTYYEPVTFLGTGEVIIKPSPSLHSPSVPQRGGGGEQKTHRGSVFRKVVKRGPIEKMTFGNRREGGEGASHGVLWGKNLPDKNDSKCKSVSEKYRAGH